MKNQHSLIEFGVLFVLCTGCIYIFNLGLSKDILIIAGIIWGIIVFWSYIFGEYSSFLRPHFGINLKTQKIFLFTVLTILILRSATKKFAMVHNYFEAFGVLWIYMNFAAPFLRIFLQKYIPKPIIFVTSNSVPPFHLFWKSARKLTFEKFLELLVNSCFEDLNKNYFVVVESKHLNEQIKGIDARKKGLYKLVIIKNKSFINYLFDTHIKNIEPAPMESSEYRLKRIIDYTLAIIGLLLLLPVFLVISLCIKLESPGGVFYRHKRLGIHMRTFNLYKFRTMYVDADKILNDLLQNNPRFRKEFETTFKLRKDPRVTRIGRILRKLSLDELPQLINVLKGEISLVGPRPIVKEEIPYYQKISLDLFTVLPGLSGLWQISGRSDTSYNERVRLDTEYAKTWSLWSDLKIMFKTLPIIISGRGAY
ncbi:MAG: sugar transferase [candidate division WOR-3 bacterium]